MPRIRYGRGSVPLQPHQHRRHVHTGRPRHHRRVGCTWRRYRCKRAGDLGVGLEVDDRPAVVRPRTRGRARPRAASRRAARHGSGVSRRQRPWRQASRARPAADARARRSTSRRRGLHLRRRRAEDARLQAHDLRDRVAVASSATVASVACTSVPKRGPDGLDAAGHVDDRHLAGERRAIVASRLRAPSRSRCGRRSWAAPRAPAPGAARASHCSYTSRRSPSSIGRPGSSIRSSRRSPYSGWTVEGEPPRIPPHDPIAGAVRAERVQPRAARCRGPACRDPAARARCPRRRPGQPARPRAARAVARRADRPRAAPARPSRRLAPSQSGRERIVAHRGDHQQVARSRRGHVGHAHALGAIARHLVALVVEQIPRLTSRPGAPRRARASLIDVAARDLRGDVRGDVGEDHHRELEPLGPVHRHDADALARPPPRWAPPAPRPRPPRASCSTKPRNESCRPRFVRRAPAPRCGARWRAPARRTAAG